VTLAHNTLIDGSNWLALIVTLHVGGCAGPGGHFGGRPPQGETTCNCKETINKVKRKPVILSISFICLTRSCRFKRKNNWLYFARKCASWFSGIL